MFISYIKTAAAQPNLYSQKLREHFVKSVTLYLERFQRYGVLKSTTFGPPCTLWKELISAAQEILLISEFRLLHLAKALGTDDDLRLAVHWTHLNDYWNRNCNSRNYYYAVCRVNFGKRKNKATVWCPSVRPSVYCLYVPSFFLKLMRLRSISSAQKRRNAFDRHHCLLFSFKDCFTRFAAWKRFVWMNSKLNCSWISMQEKGIIHGATADAKPVPPNPLWRLLALIWLPTRNSIWKLEYSTNN